MPLPRGSIFHRWLPSRRFRPVRACWTAGKQFKANVDWELFTGVKLFAGLGGLALFIGAGFFVKYSIDRNLIPAGAPAGRQRRASAWR